MASVTYGKSIYGKSTMANETEPIGLDKIHWSIIKIIGLDISMDQPSRSKDKIRTWITHRDHGIREKPGSTIKTIGLDKMLDQPSRT